MLNRITNEYLCCVRAATAMHFSLPCFEVEVDMRDVQLLVT